MAKVELRGFVFGCPSTGQDTTVGCFQGGGAPLYLFDVVGHGRLGYAVSKTENCTKPTAVCARAPAERPWVLGARGKQQVRASAVDGHSIYSYGVERNEKFAGFSR